MSHNKLYLRGLSLGYVATGAGILYSLVTIPIIIHYVGIKEFGLWSVVLQLVSYLQLLDFGVPGSVGRLLIDYKKDRPAGRYASILYAGVAIQSCIGLCIIILSWSLSAILAQWMQIPNEFQKDFALVLSLVGTVSGCSLALRSLIGPLYANQREDLMALIQLGFYPISLLGIGVGIYLDLGIFSLFLSLVLGFLWNALTPICLNFYLGFLPQKNEKAQVSLAVFQEVFAISRNVFFINLSSFALRSAPILIVTKYLGLEAAAVWAVVWKPFQIIMQIFQRPVASAWAFFANFYADGNFDKIRIKFSSLLNILAAFTICGAITLAALVPNFVAIWTSEKIETDFILPLSMALMIVCYSISDLINGFVGISKKYHFLPLLSVVEILFFLTGSILMIQIIGIVAVPFMAVLARGIITLPFGISYLGKDFQISSSLIFQNIRGGVLAGVVLGLVLFFVPGSFFAGNMFMFFWQTVAFGVLGLAVFVKLALTKENYRMIITKVRMLPWDFKTR